MLVTVSQCVGNRSDALHDTLLLSRYCRCMTRRPAGDWRTDGHVRRAGRRAHRPVWADSTRRLPGGPPGPCYTAYGSWFGNTVRRLDRDNFVGWIDRWKEGV